MVSVKASHRLKCHLVAMMGIMRFHEYMKSVRKDWQEKCIVLFYKEGVQHYYISSIPHFSVTCFGCKTELPLLFGNRKE